MVLLTQSKVLRAQTGRILGKMGHSERCYREILKNVPGKMDQKLFKSGINYYRT